MSDARAGGHNLGEVLAIKCIVKDCENREDQGKFVGDLCGACFEMLSTGKIGPTLSILRKIKDAELFILRDRSGQIITQGQFNALVAEHADFKRRERNAIERLRTAIEWLKNAKQLAIRYCAMDGDEMSVLAKGIHEFLG